VPRIQPVDRHTTQPDIAQLLDAVEQKLGVVPNLISTMAQSPAVAHAYLNLSGALAAGLFIARDEDEWVCVDLRAKK